VIIKIILAVAIGVIVLWFLANHNTHQARAWKKLSLISFTIISIIVVWLPDTANRAANKVGVGRGADLLLYLLTLAFIFSTLGLYIKSREDQRKIVKLARRIALIETELRDKNKVKRTAG
jgi:hypothetical protein